MAFVFNPFRTIEAILEFLRLAIYRLLEIKTTKGPNDSKVNYALKCSINIVAEILLTPFNFLKFMVDAVFFIPLYLIASCLHTTIKMGEKLHSTIQKGFFAENHSSSSPPSSPAATIVK